MLAVGVGVSPVLTGGGGGGLTPNQFSFVDYTDINPNQLQFSTTITVAGMAAGVTATATLTGDSSSRMSIDSGSGFGAFVAGPVAGIANGYRIFLRQLSSSAGATTVSTTLTIGTTSDTWTTTTIATLATPTLAINSALGATPVDFLFSSSDYTVGQYGHLQIASDSGFSTITQDLPFFIDGASWSINRETVPNFVDPTAEYWARARTWRDNENADPVVIAGQTYNADVSNWSTAVHDPWTAFKGFTISTVKPTSINTGSTATFSGVDFKAGGLGLVYVYLNSTTATVSAVKIVGAGAAGADINLVRQHNSTSGGRQEIWVAPDGTTIAADGNYNVVVTPSVTLTFYCGIISGTLMNVTSGVPTSTALKNRAASGDPKTTTSAVTVPSGGFGLSFIEDENISNSITVNSGTLIGSGFMTRPDLTSHATGFALSQLTAGSWTPSYSMQGGGGSNGQLAGAWT